MKNKYRLIRNTVTGYYAVEKKLGWFCPWIRVYTFGGVIKTKEEAQEIMNRMIQRELEIDAWEPED